MEKSSKCQIYKIVNRRLCFQQRLITAEVLFFGEYNRSCCVFRYKDAILSLFLCVSMSILQNRFIRIAMSSPVFVVFMTILKFLFCFGLFSHSKYIFVFVPNYLNSFV